MNENNYLQDEYMKSITKLCYKMKDFCSLKSNNDDKEKPFNIILASSDMYYRENYHSDIIFYILDHKNILNHKKEYTLLFINFLNINLRANKKAEINVENYLSPIITREKDKIDILIKDEKTRHCIIIENKINNAKDTVRQLPKYYNLLIEHNYIVDKIVYLSLDGNKTPDKSKWGDQDHKLGLEDKLIICAVSNKSDVDLINGFLRKCLFEAKTVQENSFFSQYINLLVFLGRKQMDYQLMESFYKQMNSSPEEHNTALGIKSMLDALSKYRNELSYNTFKNKHKPFRDIDPLWSTNWVLRKIPDITGEDVIVIIDSINEKYTKMTFKINNPGVQHDLIEIILKQLGLLEDFIRFEKNEYYKDFSYPEEEKTFYSYFENFLFSLESNKVKIKETINMT